MIKAIIIDDELNARKYLEKLIIRYFPKKISILEICDSVETGVHAIRQHHPDLVFLDIQMPNENGFELFKYFDTINFEVIFTTAHIDYTIDAIRHSALDYVLKPINYVDLLSSITRFERRESSLKKEKQVTQLLQNICTEVGTFNKVALPTQNGFDLIKTNTILYCQAESNYCKVFCIDGKEYLVSKTLKYVEELLGNDIFLRVHKSFLVNLNYIVKYDKSDDLKITIVNGQELPISFRKKEQFLNAILHKK